MTGGGPDAALLERLLTDAFGTPLEVHRIERVEPWCVSRVHLVGPATLTVMVKWVRYGTTRADPMQTVTERTTRIPGEPRAATGPETHRLR